MTDLVAWQPIEDKGSWGMAVSNDPREVQAALDLPGSWLMSKARRQVLVRRDQWANLPNIPPPNPILTGIVPNVGPVAGGTASTLTGQYLTGMTAVYYGGAPGSFNVQNDTTVLVTSPAKADGIPANVPVNVMRGVASNPVQFDYQ